MKKLHKFAKSLNSIEKNKIVKFPLSDSKNIDKMDKLIFIS